MGKLDSWIKENGGSWWNFKMMGDLTGTLFDIQVEPSRFNPNGVPCFYVKTDDGIFKFQTSAKRFNAQMNDIDLGTRIKISKEGEGTATKYNIEVFDA
jgi:hypothetical protein